MASPFSSNGLGLFAGLLSGLGTGMEKYRRDNEDSTAKALQILGQGDGNQTYAVRPEDLEPPSLHSKFFGGGLRTRSGDQAFQVGGNYFAVRSLPRYDQSHFDTSFGKSESQLSTERNRINQQDLSLGLTPVTPAAPMVVPAAPTTPQQPQTAAESAVPENLATYVNKRVAGNVQAFQRLSPERRRELDTIIEPLLEKYPNLTKEEVYAVLATESSFNPRAQSPMGAQGLGQLMPGTQKRHGVTNPFDPKQSVEGTVKELAALKKRFGDDQRLTYAGYNSPANLAEERIRTNSLPLETQRYIPTVMNTAAKFKTLLAGGVPPAVPASPGLTPEERRFLTQLEQEDPRYAPGGSAASLEAAVAPALPQSVTTPLAGPHLQPQETAQEANFSQLVAGPATPAPRQEMTQETVSPKLTEHRLRSGISDLTPEEYVRIQEEGRRRFMGQFQTSKINKEMTDFYTQQYEILRKDRTEVQTRYEALAKQYHFPMRQDVRTLADLARVRDGLQDRDPAQTQATHVKQAVQALRAVKDDPERLREVALEVEAKLGARHYPQAVIDNVFDKSGTKAALDLASKQAEEVGMRRVKLDTKVAEEDALREAKTQTTRRDYEERTLGQSVIPKYDSDESMIAQGLLDELRQEKKVPVDANLTALNTGTYQKEIATRANRRKIDREVEQKQAEAEAQENRPISRAQDMERYINPKTGLKLATPGQTPKELAGLGFVPIDATGRNTIEKVFQARKVLARLELLGLGGKDTNNIVGKKGEDVEGIFSGKGTISGRTYETVNEWYKALQQDPKEGINARMYQNLRGAFAGIFGRSIGGDSGHFTDQDRDYAMNLFPEVAIAGMKLQDSKEMAERQFSTLKTFLDDLLERASGYNTQQWTSETPEQIEARVRKEMGL